jgi:DNA helicase II / ATP-dependent DNA helicase PcrA
VLQADRLLEDLTDEQREAATHVDGPLLIIAAAGSGKTRVITRRVAYLMSLGIPSPSILAITFTNKAAGEMKVRVSSQLERPLRDFGRLDQPWPLICTFHSLGLRILKHYAERVGLPTNFSIYDSSDQERLIKESIKAADLSTTNFPPGTCHGAISNAKNKLLSAEQFAQAQTDFFARSIAKVYRNYERLLKQNNALDFDDLLLRTAQAFRDHPDVLSELQDRFQYILIDEYQDTNHAQYVVAHALALKHRNICVVGDPDQSIYAWRGADIQNILDFEKDYADAKVVKLEQNYRSTQTILDIADNIIKKNRQRKDKRLWTKNARGDAAKLFLCGDEHEEALTLARHLRELKEKGLSWNEMAVFYRINSLSRVMEDALRRSGVPYRIARGVDFYHRKEIKDVLAYLRVIANPNDELSLSRIVNVPARGIGDSAVKLMQVHALSNAWTLWETLQKFDQIPAVSTRSATGVRTFVQVIHRWQRLAAANPETLPISADGVQKGRLQTLIEDVVKQSGYESLLQKSTDEEKSELANVNELISSAAEFDEESPEATLEDYLNQVSLVSDIDTLDENGGAVTLMTLHAAKGLEFPVVAMIGMEEGVLPHGRVREHPEQLEEERRLCFVGITRARQRLVLSRANYRTIRGLRERTAASRFLAEIPPEMLEVHDLAGIASFGSDSRDVQHAMESERRAGQFRRGQTVRHPQFGVGKIAEISDVGQHTRAVVEFQRAGRKTLILQYARLEAVG